MSELKIGNLFTQAKERAEKTGTDYAKAKTNGFTFKFTECLYRSMSPGGPVEDQFVKKGYGNMKYANVCSDIFDHELYDRNNNYTDYLLKEYTDTINSVCKENNLKCMIVDKDGSVYLHQSDKPYKVHVELSK